MQRLSLNSKLAKAAAVAVAVLSVAADASAPRLPVVITYEALGCTARCPVYNILMIGTSLTFSGTKNTKFIGKREIEIDQHWAEYSSQIIKDVVRSKKNIFQSKSIECKGFNPRVQTIKITWFDNGYEGELSWNFGCVEDIDDHTQAIIKTFPEKIRLSNLISGGSSAPFPSFTGTL